MMKNQNLGCIVIRVSLIALDNIDKFIVNAVKI